MASTPLSDRAKHRLKIAAALMRGTGKKAKTLSVTREGFYDGIQALIAALPEEEKLKLKEQTDWLEAYDNASLPAQDSKA